MIRIAGVLGLPRPRESDRPAVEHDLAFVFGDRAGQDLHERALARPVLAAEGEDLARARARMTRPAARARRRSSWRCAASRAGSARAAPASARFGSWPMGGSIQKRHRVVNLPGDFDETDRRIEMPADRVLLEGLDLGDRHSGRAEMRQGVLDQPPAQPLPPCLRSPRPGCGSSRSASRGRTAS